MTDGTAAAADSDALIRLRDELERVDALPVCERVERFEYVNEAIARELARLDEI